MSQRVRERGREIKREREREREKERGRVRELRIVFILLTFAEQERAEYQHFTRLQYKRTEC